MSFDNGQLRGAYSAGYEAGVRAGIERMSSEGWKRWEVGDHLPNIGEIVKTLVPTMSGWIGLGKVIRVSPFSIDVSKLDQLTGDPDEDWSKTATLFMDQVAVKRTTHPKD